MSRSVSKAYNYAQRIRVPEIHGGVPNLGEISLSVSMVREKNHFRVGEEETAHICQSVLPTLQERDRDFSRFAIRALAARAEETETAIMELGHT